MKKAYCASCSQKREMKDPTKETAENGRKYLKGDCVQCGNTILRFVKD